MKNKKSAASSMILGVAFICCVVDFGILTLIQKAYSVLAYLAIPVILIPYLIHMAVTRFDTK